MPSKIKPSRKLRTIDDITGQPPGSFKKYIKEQSAVEALGQRWVSFNRYYGKSNKEYKPIPPKCPKCSSILDIMHDETGMYFKCSSCKFEFPSRK